MRQKAMKPWSVPYSFREISSTYLKNLPQQNVGNHGSIHLVYRDDQMDALQLAPLKKSTSYSPGSFPNPFLMSVDAPRLISNSAIALC